MEAGESLARGALGYRLRRMSGFAEIAENFAFLEEWPARYEYLMDLGKQLPGFEEARKDEAHRVHGCMSQVWLDLTLDAQGKVVLDADSDAFIVRGLLALLVALYTGLSPEEAAALDARAELEPLGLDAQLSPTRRNGLGAMLSRIRETVPALRAR